ncbi:MAG: DUF2946 family protein [Methyloceanibacter sp.]
MAWALLLQSAILSFSFGLHASAYAAMPDQTAVLCSVQGAVVDGQLPAEHHQQHDLACCTLACRLACGSVAGGMLADHVRVPLPGSVAILVEAQRIEAIPGHGADLISAQPRAPPLA